MRPRQQINFGTEFTDFGKAATVGPDVIVDNALTDVFVNGQLESFVVITLERLKVVA